MDTTDNSTLNRPDPTCTVNIINNTPDNAENTSNSTHNTEEDIMTFVFGEASDSEQIESDWEDSDCEDSDSDGEGYDTDNELVLIDL